VLDKDQESPLSAISFKRLLQFTGFKTQWERLKYFFHPKIFLSVRNNEYTNNFMGGVLFD